MSEQTIKIKEYRRMPEERVSVMQVISSLSLGGAERMAVNLTNSLPRAAYRIHLCTTRIDGPLDSQVSSDVGRLRLRRKSRLSEPGAILKLARYIRKHEIRILHCHQKTVFLCMVALVFCPSTKLVWHDHFGRVTRPRWLYKILRLRVSAVISVNEELAEWARKELGFSENKVYFIKNFVVPSKRNGDPDLPIKSETLVVCTASIRPPKDITNFIRAMHLVTERVPDVNAIVIGGSNDETYLSEVRNCISEFELEDKVILLGPRNDVADILPMCDVAVVSSKAEGLPLALLEYGMAGLATVATKVGQCPDVLGGGRHGILVPPCDSPALAEGIIRLLTNEVERDQKGRSFRRATLENYGPDKNVRRVTDIYQSVAG